MSRCGCDKQTCACIVIAGQGIQVAGVGGADNPYVISASGTGGGGTGGFAAGDIKETAATGPQAGWLDADGTAVSRSSYPALFAAIGTFYGKGDGNSTFNLPDYRGKFRPGSGPGYPLGAVGGDASTQLTVGNLPAHTHDMRHRHPINHNHPSFQTKNTEGKHQHDGVGVNLPQNTDQGGDQDTGNSDVPTREVTINGTKFDAVQNNGTHKHSQPAHNHGLTQESGDWNGRVTKGSGGVPKTSQITVGDGGIHQHTIDTPAFNGSSGDATRDDTGSTGGGSAFTNLPPYRATRVLIKT